MESDRKDAGQKPLTNENIEHYYTHILAFMAAILLCSSIALL